MHAFSKDPEHITREADIVVAAAGIPNLVRGSWLKRGAVVIDVGTCPVEVKWETIFLNWSKLLYFPVNKELKTHTISMKSILIQKKTLKLNSTPLLLG